MAARIPWRDTVGFATPKQIFEFGEKIHNKLKVDEAEKNARYEASGKISGGKLGQPTLWAALNIIGVPRDFDPYLLGKFKRGNDVEARAIDFLTGIDMYEHDDGVWIKSPAGAILQGDFMLQMEQGYRGGTGYIDLVQSIAEGSPLIFHEIKSATKMAYDRVAATGRSSKGKPSPYYHHCVQLAYYCLGAGVHRAYLHYLNADDYRLTTFSINPLDYKDEIDKEVDDLQAVFLTKQLPSFEAFLDYHKQYKDSTYGEWNVLTPGQMMEKLKIQYPDSYKKFMETTL